MFISVLLITFFENPIIIMRLLKLEDYDEFSLIEFISDKILWYAILLYT